MNVLEVFGIAFIALVVINLISMIWAIKNINLTKEQEI